MTPLLPTLLHFALVLLLHISLTCAEVTVNYPEPLVTSKLRYPKTVHVYDDDWKEFKDLHPRLKRWIRAPNSLEQDPINMVEIPTPIRNAEHPSASPNDFRVTTLGFERIRLNPKILPILSEIKVKGLSGARVGPTTAGSRFLFLGGGTDDTVEDKLARELQGSSSFSLKGDFHYAFRCAGFVIRKGGPEGAKLNGSYGFDQVAQRVHIDQDLAGEPLLSMGLTYVFKLPFVHLLNIWSPLFDVRMRPLAFADKRTVDPTAEVLRYRTNSTQNAGGRFGSFASDRLMSLYSENHQWYYFPGIKFGEALAFDTGSVPHTSFSLPGEEVLGAIRNDIVDIVERKDFSSCLTSRRSPLSDAKMTLEVETYVGAAEAMKIRACEGRVGREDADYAEVLEYLSRASLEIRCVTYVGPYSVFGGALFAAAAVVASAVYKVMNWMVVGKGKW